MKAMVLHKVVSLGETDAPLKLEEVPMPRPGRGELLLRVGACGVCHTELDEIEGGAAPSVLPIILGHEVVGRVAELGSGVKTFHEGDRVGVGPIHYLQRHF